MADRRNVPSTKPHARPDGGYRRCPGCGLKHRVGGHTKPSADPTQATVSWRVLTSGEMKSAVIERAKREKISMSAFVRAAVRYYLATHP